MARNFSLSVSTLLFCLLSLTSNLLGYSSSVLQEAQAASPISIQPLGPTLPQVPSPGIAAVLPFAQNNVWLAGSSSPSSALTVPLYEHFDGAKWTLVASPHLGDGGGIAGLSALSARDIWAVGSYRTNSEYPVDLPLVEHWDGSRWNFLNQKYTHTFATASLTAVVALSPHNVWMVGTQRRSMGDPTTQTFIEHWDGSQVQAIPSPNPVHTISNYLKTITACAANDLWAAGISDTGNTLTEHWDGSQWSVVSSPNITLNQGVPNFNLLASLSSVSPADVWAAGLFNATDASLKGALTEHWNGSQWSVVSLQNLPGASQELSAIVSLSANEAWALGTSTTANKALPLLVRWNGSSWHSVPLPSSLPTLHYLQRLASSSTTFVSLGTNSNGALQLVLLHKNS